MKLLGGATTHCEISGVTDYKAKDDKDALDTIKRIIDKIGDYDKAGFNRAKPKNQKKIQKIFTEFYLNHVQINMICKKLLNA